MKFDWDSKKAKANLGKHGVSFDEGATVFVDPMAVAGPDPDHSLDEDRYITFGFSASVGCRPYATFTGSARFESLMHVV